MDRFPAFVSCSLSLSALVVAPHHSPFELGNLTDCNYTLSGAFTSLWLDNNFNSIPATNAFPSISYNIAGVSCNFVNPILVLLIPPLKPECVYSMAQSSNGLNMIYLERAAIPCGTQDSLSDICTLVLPVGFQFPTLAHNYLYCHLFTSSGKREHKYTHFNPPPPPRSVLQSVP